ncbi:MAG TPA: TIGR02597 family protein, partial [Luteolibacter sp.]
MKPTLFTLLAAVAACGFATAQETAYTTPVGYVSIAVPANADSTVTAPLTRPTLYAGASSSISGDIVGASGLTASAFVASACYLKVTSGSLDGAFFPITENTTSTITVDAGATTLQSLGFASGNTFKVIPYWTLG